LTATLIGIFIVPVLFVLVERVTHRKERTPVTRKTEVGAVEGVAD